MKREKLISQVQVITLLIPLLVLVGCAENSLTFPTSSGVGAASLGTPSSDVIESSGSWTSLSSMPTARSGLSSTTLDGLVYAIGGAGRIFGFDGIGSVAVNSVDVYDPSTNAWRGAAQLPATRVYANGAAVIDHRIYLPGGSGCDVPGCRETNTLFIFDPAAGPQGAWTVGPPMPAVIEGGTSGAINDQLYVLAGWSIGAPRQYFFQFNTANQVWTQLPDSPHGHTFGASAVLGGKFYATGGEGNGNAFDIYDPSTGTWTAGTMPVGYQHHAAVTIDNILYLVGGYQFIGGECCSVNIVTAYNPATDSWTTPAPVPASGGPYVGTAGVALTFAGSSSNTLQAMSSVLNLPAATGLSGTLYIMGGQDATDSHVLSTLLALNPPGTARLDFNWDFGDGEHAIGERPTHTFVTPGTYTVTLTVSTPDGRHGTSTVLATISDPPNAAPTADAGGPYGDLEGNAITFSAARSRDADNDALSYAWNFGDGATGTGVAPRHAYADNGTYTVTLTVTDSHGASSERASTNASISNVAPTITGFSVTTIPVPVGSTVALAASFTDPSTLDTHTAAVDWDDGIGPVAGPVDQSTRTVTASRTFSAAGVYTVSLLVTDDDGGQGTSTATSYVVVYDPSAGFVTGGGWIESPQGSYAVNPTLTGKASFGFVSMYKKGATVPTGNTQFQFETAGLNFTSSALQWLVVAGSKAQFKGSGEVNGAGAYGFLLSAVDGQVNGGQGVDRFRIKIWYIPTGTVIYENQMGSGDDATATTALGGGSVVIHQ